MESYVYLGVGTVVAWDHPQTGVDETYISPTGSIGAAGDDIIGLDQFGRVVDDAYINAVTGQYTDEFLYTYDQDSNVVSMTNALYTAYSQTYSYNNLNELTGYTQGDGSSQSINYDALGNITSTTTGGVQVARTSNAQNEYTSVSGSTASPTYDANGNLTTDPTTGNQFTYNAWNQLVSVSNGGTVLATFEFDALGRMVAETTSGTTTDMYYNTQGQIIEERVSGQVTTQYVWCSLGTNQLVCTNYDPVNGVPTQRVYIQQDAIGNVMSLVSTSGNVVDRYSYTPFGQSTQYLASDPDIPISYGFQCMFTYGSLGIAQDGERIYDFSLQVFAQMDPIGMADGSANGYEFVNNNPVNWTDPSGMAPLPGGTGPWNPYEGFLDPFKTQDEKRKQELDNEQKFSDWLRQVEEQNHKDKLEIIDWLCPLPNKERAEAIEKEERRHQTRMAEIDADQRIVENNIKEKYSMFPFGNGNGPKALPPFPPFPPPFMGPPAPPENYENYGDGPLFRGEWGPFRFEADYGPELPEGNHKRTNPYPEWLPGRGVEGRGGITF